MSRSRPTNPPAQADRMLTTREILDLTSLSRSTLFRLVKAGKFPRPSVLGSTKRWFERDIVEFIEHMRAELSAKRR